MALHGGGHLELKKCTKGIFGASSEFVWGDVQVSFLKKSAFCNFIPGSCVFFTNALALNKKTGSSLMDTPRRYKSSAFIYTCFILFYASAFINIYFIMVMHLYLYSFMFSLFYASAFRYMFGFLCICINLYPLYFIKSDNKKTRSI